MYQRSKKGKCSYINTLQREWAPFGDARVNHKVTNNREKIRESALRVMGRQETRLKSMGHKIGACRGGAWWVFEMTGRRISYINQLLSY